MTQVVDGVIQNPGPDPGKDPVSPDEERQEDGAQVTQVEDPHAKDETIVVSDRDSGSGKSRRSHRWSRGSSGEGHHGSREEGSSSTEKTTEGMILAVIRFGIQFSDSLLRSVLLSFAGNNDIPYFALSPYFAARRVLCFTLLFST